MRIITPKGTFDTEKESIILMFNDDNELSEFISTLIKTPTRTSGVRVLPLINRDKELTPLQVSLLNVLEGLDGIGGKEHESICDNAIDEINDILKS